MDEKTKSIFGERIEALKIDIKDLEVVCRLRKDLVLRSKQAYDKAFDEFIKNYDLSGAAITYNTQFLLFQENEKQFHYAVESLEKYKIAVRTLENILNGSNLVDEGFGMDLQMPPFGAAKRNDGDKN